ncbi:hypothetical protein HaLaN_26447 [Haematococcus lacustris]|uniref:Uncharacterized protein n=1 Tax=Haematococcus lacustris TaxID=44745 RepID=A0A6A0A6A9_HAELA|nr:hypothetical protein HaLaN_26447 [Haematococcus lacustris]
MRGSVELKWFARWFARWIITRV